MSNTIDLQMKIIKTVSGGGDDSYSVYDFSLWGNGVPNVHEQVILPANIANERSREMHYLSDHISTFLRGDAKTADEPYIASVNQWVYDVSETIKEFYLPRQQTSFGKIMIDFENQARNGSNIYLTIYTNEYLVPFWLAQPYSYSTNKDHIFWNMLFATGFIPSHISDSQIPTHFPKRERIALVSRPAYDLDRAKDISKHINNLDRAIVDKIHIIDGEQNKTRERINRFGLLWDEVEQAIQDSDMLLYYGHFELDDDAIQSKILVLKKRTFGKSDVQIGHEKIPLESFKDKIQGKVLFLDACQSIGLPYFQKEPFPRHDKTLPHFFLNNGNICVGTLYPIFHDAAAKYMQLFLRNLAANYPIGEAVRRSCVELSEIKNYEAFDWASYLLVGKPNTSVQIT